MGHAQAQPCPGPGGCRARLPVKNRALKSLVNESAARARRYPSGEDAGKEAMRRELPRRLGFNDIARKDPLLGSCLSYLAGLRVGEVYLVGGYIRDFLLGMVPADVDFITDAPPAMLSEAVAERFDGNSFILHDEEGIYRVTLRDGGILRTLDFSPVKGRSLREDLSQRDFTVNAMALEVGKLVGAGEVILPQDIIDTGYGWRDLAEGVLRECSNHAFLDDPVRILRGIRFRRLLDMAYEERTLNHMRKYAPLLAKAPGERVATEVLETLIFRGCAEVFAEMEELTVLFHVFPGLADTVGVPQNAYHHLDVWSHTLQTLRELERLLEDSGSAYPGFEEMIREHLEEPLHDTYSRAVFLKLAALYHDAGKPESFSMDETGRIHFFGHQALSAEKAAAMAERLRLSRKASEYLERVVSRHMDIGLALGGEIGPRTPARLVARLGDVLVDVVLLSTADRFATRGPLTTEEGLRRYVGFCQELLQESLRQADIPPLVGGRDIMEELGIGEGPLVGRLLREVRARQLEGEVTTRREALELARRLLSQGLPEARGEGADRAPGPPVAGRGGS